MVSIPACHAGDRGSIPRRGGLSTYAFNLCSEGLVFSSDGCKQMKIQQPGISTGVKYGWMDSSCRPASETSATANVTASQAQHKRCSNSNKGTVGLPAADGTRGFGLTGSDVAPLSRSWNLLSSSKSSDWGRHSTFLQLHLHRHLPPVTGLKGSRTRSRLGSWAWF